MKYQIGFLDFGNLGRGVSPALSQTPDLEASAVFTRREATALSGKTNDIPVFRQDSHDARIWVRGVNRDHLVTLRRIKGVRNAKQYTLPVKNALEAVRSGKAPEPTMR